MKGRLSLVWKALRIALIRLRFVGLVAVAALLAAEMDDLSALARGLLAHGRASAPQDAAVDYVCPMDPDIVAKAPGACPKCGMRLVRRAAAPKPTVEYVCPMHPDAARTEPGKCPACGMPLRRREEGELAHAALTTARVRLGGIAFATVERRPLEREVNAAATLELDERRVARLATPLRAAVQYVHVAAPGAAVRRGEVIATLASRELYQYARELQKGLPGEDATVVLARQRLFQLGLSDAQIDRIRAGHDPTRFDLLSPLDGVLVAKTVSAGDQVPELTSVVTLADLSHLWLVARLNEDDALLARPGTTLEGEALALPGLTLRGRVQWIDAAVDPQTRTLAVRAEVENPDGRLRPGMTARARLKVPVGSAEEPPLIVPVSAVVDSGLHQVVWREDEESTLEAVEVKIAARVGQVYAIASGLAEGDRVVSQGAFLLSADQRLKKGGAQQMGEASRSGAGGEK